MVEILRVTQRYAGLARAAEYAGVSQESLRRKIRAGQLKAFRPFGGKILIDLQQLDELIQQAADYESTRGRHLHQKVTA